MKDFRHGLVIGKFYPPHAGHLYLIESAARHCKQVTAVCMAASQESISLALRVAWLEEALRSCPHVSVRGIVDDVPVDYADPAIWQAHVDLMREAIADADRGRAPVPVDAVFTSEDYGAELARHFQAASVCLDQARALYPVSGTAVRADPPAHWDLLPAAARAWLCLRVVIVGAESTGKTTLAAALAAHYRQRAAPWSRVGWVPEFGREHSQNKLAIARGLALQAGLPLPRPQDLEWESAEFEVIASRQRALEDENARSGGPLLVCDTDAFATTLWHERYMGRRLPALSALAVPSSPHRLYLLTDVHAVPFEQDGLRDGEHIREWMHGRFVEELQAAGHTWRLLTGSAQDMQAQATAAITDALASTWRFAAPLG